MRRIKGQTGMSLVEALIILLVLMLLTGVLAPSIFEFIPDAKGVKVKEDCEAIGVEIAKLVRDVGPCLQLHYAGPVAGCTPRNQVGVLGSDGAEVTTLNDPEVVQTFGVAGQWAWWTMDQSWGGDTMENQLVINAPHYPLPSQGNPVGFDMTGPFFNLGWRGPYLAPQIGPDPWGQKYLVNTLFLTANAYRNQGLRGWDHPVFCISAGPNNVYETPFGGNANGGVTRGGDDFIYVIQGSTR